MADPRTGNIERQDSESEHIGPDYTGDNISAKKVANYEWNGTQWQRQAASSTYSASASTQNTSGDNAVVSITNSPRLYYISVSADGANSADVTVTVKIGASEKFKVSLKAGSIFARNIGAGRRYLTGSTGDDIIVNLSAAQTVHVSVEYEDI